MRMMFIVLCSLFMAPAFAIEQATAPAFDLVQFILSLLGEQPTAVMIIVSVLGFTWSQCRQLISAETLAKLPTWMIWFLEMLAANKGKASNLLANRPEEHSKWRGQK